MEYIAEINRNKLDKCTLVLDESHLIVTTASQKYRGKEMTYVVNNYKRFKRTIQLTATPPVDLVISDECQYVINRKISKPRHFINVDTFENSPSAVTALKISQLLKDANPVNIIVYLNNISEEGLFGSFMNELAGYDLKEEVSAINSSTKNSEDFKTLILEGKLNKTITVCTSLLTEAISIVDPKDTHIFLLGYWDPISTVQIQARPRNSEVWIYNVQKETKYSEKDYTIKFEDELINANKLLEWIKSGASILKDKPEELISLQKHFETSGIFETIDTKDTIRDNWHVNHVLLHNYCYQSLIKNCQFNYDNHCDEIKRLISLTGSIDNWYFDENPEKDLLKVSKDVKRKQDVAKKALAEKNKAHKDRILQDLRACSLDELTSIINSGKLNDVRLAGNDLRIVSTVENIYKAGDASNMNIVIDYIINNNVTFNDSKILDLRNRLLTDIENKNYGHNELYTFINSVKIGNTYSADQKQELIESHLDGYLTGICRDIEYSVNSNSIWNALFEDKKTTNSENETVYEVLNTHNKFKL